MTHRISAWLLKRLGWSIQGQIPATGRYIIIVGPHTSNWDFPIGILAQWALGMNANFIGKHQLFRWPLGWFFRALGGFPVNRGKQNNLVNTAIELFASQENFILALAPEGTRKPVNRWKTGFYHIAKQARVPIYCAGLDFKSKTVIIRAPLVPGNDMASDMNTILDFFRAIPGKYPQPVPRYSG
ncbi:1-acyl-sn-glycerol-3-phosphate acyltransferases [Ferrimonas sediminum]|uniref:1-acyl-sn-glycerol-3-phosphate acyltransferases n=1 Tax=Ferrimonas sediminum TaxID=718193 RepID=A0A1G8JBX4_9GAMM|nr:lysophospholipid acyltransferase family protein [Ferrimonas sediminum]SDI28592.1 1-acyl-sn-glycerol-3-phosphate acyltransferases [Ferrimonas sediminum]